MSSPEANILSFSHRCGSGVNGAKPSVRDSTIKSDRGIRLNKLRIVDMSVKERILIHRIILIKLQCCYSGTLS